MPTQLRKFKFRAIPLVLIFCASVFPLKASSSGILVLPFLIQGNPEKAGLSDVAQLPEHMQQAAHFLLPTLRSYPLQNLESTRSSLETAGWSSGETLDQRLADRICIAARVDYLVAGSAQFIEASQTFVKSSVYSCREHKIAASAREAGSVTQLQSLLRKALLASTPFLPAAQNAVDASPGQHADQRPLDLAIILDYSGSMIADIPSILRSLTAIHGALPSGSRLGVVAMNGSSVGGNIEILPFTTEWTATLETLYRKKAGGSNNVAALESALSIVNQYRDWQARRMLMIFTTVGSGERRMTGVESQLRRLQSSGIQLRLFPVLNQDHNQRAEWQRLIRVLSLPSAELVYGREILFADGQSSFMVLKSNRFYHTTGSQDISGLIQRDRLDMNVLRGIETIHYQREDLNLNRLPQAYARVTGRRLTSMGPVVSNLEVRMAALVGGTADLTDGNRLTPVLVKNRGHAFRIYVRDAAMVERLRSMRNQNIYLGLRFRSDATSSAGIVNLPGPVYIRNYANVPQLFIQSHERLVRLPTGAIDNQDIWFLFVTILEIEDDRSGDIRR